MTVFFHLRFSTRYGQRLLVYGDHPALGSGDPDKALPLKFQDAQGWTGEVKIPTSKKEVHFAYKYLLQESDGRITAEWGMDRQIALTPSSASLQTIDTWSHAGDFEQTFYTGPFRNILLPHRYGPTDPIACASETVLFRVKAPLLKADESIRLIGSENGLGAWTESRSVPMKLNGVWWEAKIPAGELQATTRYKYGVYNDQTEQWVCYESGADRNLDRLNSDFLGGTIVHDGFIRLPNNTWRAAGLSVPVFSIRTEQSFGVGEFADLNLLADWGKQLGLRLIQILPVNDTTAYHNWKDSYPYAGISAFALHPQYISIREVAGPEHADLLNDWEEERNRLNASPVVDYEGVMKAKWSMLRVLYERIGKSCLSSAAYKTYWKEQQHWLKPYCLFSYLRDLYQTADFSEWPEHNTYDSEAIKTLLKSGTRSAREIAFYGFVQFHLHLQLKSAVEYLHAQGLILKGDIPIGVNRHGCDAWISPELYHMNWQAGAPPDDFTAIGQNWGFPTYNWKRMQADGFTWWRQRFEQMELYYDAFRIDHILGFFRIWSIPTHAVEGLLGRFVPAIPVQPAEFTQRGISFDADRYCKPYINDTYLAQVFGSDADAIRSHFLEPAHMGTYALKPAYTTQKQIERYFQHNDTWPAGTREMLYQLVANVILFAEEGNESAYHFRISMDKTYSYACLPSEIQRSLYELYLDYFFRRQDDFWFREAMQKLPSLKSATNMLVCGEDLGMVPHCVPDVMQQLGMLSLEIQRMPKDPNRTFFNPKEAPYLSVVTPSTHDMSTIRGWWEEMPERTQSFYNQEMQQWGEAPHYCEAWVNRTIVEQHLLSPAMWSIFQVQDILGCSDSLRRTLPQEERINDPANPNQYWQYRMHLPLEQLNREQSFNEEFNRAVQQAGRAV